MEAELAGRGAREPESESGLVRPDRPPPSPPQPPRQQAEPNAEGSPPPTLDRSPTSPPAINTPTVAAAAASSVSLSAVETLAEPARTAEDGGGGGGGGGGVGGGGSRCSFSQLLAGAIGSAAVPVLAVPVDAARLPMVAVPCFIAPASLLDSPGFSGQFAMTHQAVLATVTAQAQLHLQLQASHPSSSSDLSAKASPLPSVSPFTPLPLQQKLPPITEETVRTPEAEPSPSPSPCLKPQSARIVLRTNSSDGFSWRKYGQKQVKSSDSSRSYYRCANADCCVRKKVQHFEDGRVIEIVYKGCHNHDPPQKTRFSKATKSLSAAPLVESEDLEPLSEDKLDGSDPLTPKTEKDCDNIIPEQQLLCSSNCEDKAGIKTEDLGDEPEPKRRLSESTIPSSTSPSSAPHLKTIRGPKIVIQSAGDVGLVSDGFKWRKYGQKLVKGNPNPRSYYRCTYLGCPVRKHVERASDDAKAFVITYEGKHNHGQPSPRNGSSALSTALLDAATVVSDGGQTQTSGSLLDQKPTPELLHDANGEVCDEKSLGSDKALNSVQTHSSEGSRNHSESIQRPLFDETHAAVAVQNT